MASKLSLFLAELKRRKVYNVAAVYTAVGVAISIAVPDLFGAFGFPEWAAPLVIVLIVIGLPIALVLAWAYEVRPEGPREGEPTGITETPQAVPPGQGKAQELAQAAPVRGAPARGDDRPFLVVLPFENLSGDPENEYFSDGVTEDIMTHLAGIRGLRVISRTTAMKYKGTDLKLLEIAEELGVSAVVEGTVRRSGDRVRVTAQLISADRDEHLWASTYDRNLEDVFAVQSDVARNIVAALQTELSPGERIALGRKPTENLEAYDLTLKGLSLAESMSPGRLDQAEQYFQAALALDSRLAKAHVGIGMSRLLRGFFIINVRPSDIFPAVKSAAEKTLELDPDNGLAHALLAALAIYHEWDWARAESEIETALELGAADAWGYGLKGVRLVVLERYQEAEDALKQAVRVDPLSPLRCGELAQMYSYSGRPEVGVSILEDILRRDPMIAGARHTLALCHLYAGNLQAAADHLDQAIEIHGRIPFFVAIRGVVHWAAGAAERARRLLDELLFRDTQEYVDPYALWALAFPLEGPEGALPFLDRAIEERSLIVPYTRCVPRYKDLRSDPGFLSALRRVWPDDF